MNKLQILLSSNRLTSPGMRFLSYIKNDVLGPKIEDLLIDKMIRGWKNMQILDVGSGPCRKFSSRKFRGVDITCFDIYKPYLSICQGLGFKTVNGDARNLDSYFSPKTFDIVLLLDVLEHFEKKDAINILKKLDKIARKQIIIWTPVGEYPQDYDLVDEPWKESGQVRARHKNIYQQHLSTWYPSELEKKGYACNVLKNFHFDIRSVSHELKNRPTPVSASQMWAIKLK